MFSGKLTGRFLTLDRPLGDVEEIFSRATPKAWRNDLPVQKLRRGWCRSAPPYGGDLESETEDLGYMDGGCGLWRLWIRQDERTVGRKAILAMAAVMISQDGRREIDLARAERDEYLASAKKLLMQRAVPRTRIIECLLSSNDGWAWIGDRSGHDQWSRRMLWPVCGPVTPDPVCWGFGSEPGWGVLSRAALVGCVRLDGDELVIGTGVTLVDVRLKGTRVRCSVQGDGDGDAVAQARRTLRSVLDDPSSSISKLTLRVQSAGEAVLVTVDEDGLVQADPPVSRGGLIGDRLERRFRDARQAAERVGAVMRAVVEDVAESDDGR